ncbi:glycosyltransferase family 2 protein [Adlercreutzia caecimuris]|uniref:glycosyltransferase family 2 protein n=1 Tax=Adlercreutzia caecimuris TaxID=671266 RepID=UPI001C3E3274|nr:glycosyltransferase family 2 protein [Adlercreutzia caecimuris]MCR2037366.1 glycosyltransferase family 2 protein [Adlercreutzia caecimuris]
MPLLSLIVPCHNEAESIPLFYAETSAVMKCMSADHPNLHFELIFIDDGSTDETLSVIRALPPAKESIRWVSFSRNFGKEAALRAGLECARGDYVATMDADLQDPPQLLPEMYAYVAQEGYDSAATFRENREGEPPIRSAFARLFYKIINVISEVDIVDGARDFRLMSRPMVDAILSLHEKNRFSKGIYGWVGFRTKWIPFQNKKRAAGATNWNFFSLFSYSLEGIIAFSTKPLSIAAISGTALFAIAIIAMLAIVVRTFLFGDPVAGWPSLACLILFIGGLQLLCLGVIGQYLAKTYLETKNRPLFLIDSEGVIEN